ncbi:MAG: hypothetical protein ILP11_03075 [Alphaproteobacteria bacterium]|nr:hypothetical protein [Alphaproteobacteria bacterium]
MHFSLCLRRFCYFVFIFFALLCTPTFAQEDVFRLMLIGDDFLVGETLPEQATFVYSLQKKLYLDGYNNVLVLNETKPKRTAEEVRQNIQSFIAQNPHAVILAVGYYDIPGEDQKDLEDLTQDLESIITTFQKAQIPVMLVGMELPETKPIQYRQAFERLYRYVAQEHDIILYPFLMKGVFPTLFGIHLAGHVLSNSVNPDPKGIEIILEKMYPTIIRFLQQPV